jgi:O-antigen/teichoic acid export membrane protein
MPPDVPPLDDGLTFALARLAVVMGAVQVVNLVSYRMELFVLDHYEGATGVGVYSIAMQSVESIWLVAGAMATSITAPVLRETDAAAARLVGRQAVKGLLYTAAVAVGVAAAAPFVIPLVFGHAYEKAALALALLVPGVVAYAPVNVLVVFISIRAGRPRLSLWVSVVGLVVTTVMSLVLIPSYGVSGAAVASAIGYAAGAGAAWITFSRLVAAEARYA